MDRESWDCPQGLVWPGQNLSGAACSSRLSAGPGSPKRGLARGAMEQGLGEAGHMISRGP